MDSKPINSSDLKNRELLTADKVAIGFLCITGLLMVIHSAAGSGSVYLKYGLINLIISGLIWIFGTHVRHFYALNIMRVFYPLAVIFITHLEVELFIHMIYGKGFSFDPLVSSWDAWLFGTNPHLHFHAQLPQQFWIEILHLFYISYYSLLVGGILWVWNKRTGDYPRFIFIYIGIFLTYVIFFSLFPVIGPLDYRAELFNGQTGLAALVDFLFLIGAPDGAAFPSSHVGMSVSIFLLLKPMSRRLKTGIFIIIIGISLSMVYASIHYAIDAAAGFISGWLLYRVWNGIYNIIDSKERFIDKLKRKISDLT